MNSDIFEYKKKDGDKNELGFDDTLEFEDVELDLGASEDSLSCDEDELLLDGDFLSDSSDDEFPCNDDFLSDIDDLEVTPPNKTINKFLPPSKIPSFRSDLLAALRYGVSFKTFFDFEAEKYGWVKGDIIHVPLSLGEADIADAHTSVGRLRCALIRVKEFSAFFRHREHVMRPMRLRTERVVPPLAREANYIAKLAVSRLIDKKERINIVVHPSLYSEYRNIKINDEDIIHSVDIISLIPTLLSLIDEAQYPLDHISMNFTNAFKGDADHHMLIRDLDKHGISFWREANSDKMLKVFVYYDDGSVVVKEIKIDGQPQRGTMVAANRPYSASVMKHLEVFNSAALEIHDDALSIADAGTIFESIHWTFRCPDQPFFRYDDDIESFVIKIE
ncbi:hypothetical protein [Vibrio parahaemolyticus]|uniref:hypothetical protein n=1 Tax=Vibrio parahaemolyticus TaxID=670 RepID=UPI000B518AA5|nr:hypothetical protein [Vibrio parahaemolyticus]OWT85955.1 hypothetical protein BGM05_23140 [Vibrio parahaemolyticus]